MPGRLAGGARRPLPAAALSFLLRREAPVREVAVDQDSARQIIEAYIARSKDTLIDQMGIRILEATAQRVVGTMPVSGNTQPLGLLHGGASCVLAETLGSLGSALHAGPDRITVGIEISATHHRAAAAGQVTGIASLLHGGRTITTYEIVISDEQERRVCTSRLTCMLMDRVPGRGGPGATGEAPRR
jgi:uncharacterized protein (TIGR00369 family)